MHNRQRESTTPLASLCHTVALSLLIGLPVTGLRVFAAENWPQWRGPQSSGITTESDLPVQWDRQQNVAWRMELPEPGNSSPVVIGDSVFLTQPLAEEDLRELWCVDLHTGAVRWKRSVTYAQEETTHDSNPFCSASPAADADRVIAWYGSAGLVCYDHQGELLWQRDLGPQRHMWGYGTSPVLYENLCILNFGPGDHELLIAVDKRTGQTVWQVQPLDGELELALSGTENDGNASAPQPDTARREQLRGSWGTPVLAQIAGRQQLIVNHPRRVAAYDPLTGRQLWVCGGFAPLAYTSPMIHEDTVLALGGYSGASLAVRADGSGDVTQSHRLWHKPRDGGWLGTGVVVDGYAYVCDINGICSCLEVATGERQWETRMEASGNRGGTWSTMTLGGNGLAYLLNQSGDTFVFQPDPNEYRQVARNALEEPSNSSVIPASGKLLIRTHEALWCIGKP